MMRETLVGQQESKPIWASAFGQGNVCRALWVRVFTSALVFAVTSALWAAACSTRGVSPFKSVKFNKG